MNKDESKKIYGRNLKKLRKAKGMSQEELAHALGFKNRSSINKIEVGRSSIPTDLIAKTAEVLGVSPLALFEEEPSHDSKKLFGSLFSVYDDEEDADAYESEEALPDIKYAEVSSESYEMLLEIDSLTDKEQEQVMNYIKFLKSQRGDNT